MAKKCKKPARKVRKFVPALELMLNLADTACGPAVLDDVAQILQFSGTERPSEIPDKSLGTLLTDVVANVISQCEAHLADSFVPNPNPSAPEPPYEWWDIWFPLKVLPAEGDDEKCRAALAAADTLNLARLLIYLRKRRPTQTPAVDAMVDGELLCAFALGCSYGDCVSNPDRVTTETLSAAGQRGRATRQSKWAQQNCKDQWQDFADRERFPNGDRRAKPKCSHEEACRRVAKEFDCSPKTVKNYVENRTPRRPKK